MYRIVQIKNKKGKIRTLTIPNDELKQELKEINKDLQKRGNVSRYATGFKKGEDIKSTVLSHKYSKHFYMFDITDFFGSITQEMVKQVIPNISDKCFVDGVLPQGFPTSPTISNIVMNAFDNEYGEAVEEAGGVYTRYADDMFISSEHDTFQFEVKDMLEGMLPVNLKLNETKTREYHYAHTVRMLGVNINHNGTIGLPRAYKDKLTYEIRTHQHSCDPRELLGKMAWFENIESVRFLQEFVPKTLNGTTLADFKFKLIN